MQQGQVREAAELCDTLNQQYPDYEPGWITASQLAMYVREPLIAVRAIDRALQLSPGNPAWLYQRVECLIALGDKEAAVATAQQLVKQRFSSPVMATGLGNLFSKLNMHSEAREQYQSAAELAPDDSQHHYNLAATDRFLGDIDAAREAINRCIDLSPDDADAHLLRAGLQPATGDCNHVEELTAAHERAEAGSPSRMRLCYALAKENEDIGEYEDSFRYLSEGSGIKRAGFEYDPAVDLQVMAKLQETYDEAFFQRDIEGHVNAEPIFVVGMARTGTTLVERILGSHSVVTAAGELPAFSMAVTRLCREQDDTPVSGVVDLVERSATVDFATLGELYINAARGSQLKTAHFVDKLPLNFLYLGLIHLALPKAKIVVLERDPMDTCYAVYKTLFERVYPYSYDLDELAQYFKAYQGLVEHWKSVMPGMIHTVRYEELVTEPRPVIENLLDYCGLSFEDACLAFNKSRAASTTASAVQVRSGLYQSSIGKWRNYEQQLQPVADILGVTV